MGSTSRKPALRVQPRVFIFVAVLGSIFIIAVFSFLRLPAAKITVTPTLQEKKVDQVIVLSTAATAPDFQRFILPARAVQAEGEASMTKKREGGKARQAKATGRVRLTNNQDDEQPLLPQSHLRHEGTGVYFLTNSAVRLPPHGSLDVDVTAKEEGANGNVPAGKFIVDRLPAPLQAVVYGESTSGFSGGEIFDTPLTEGELTSAQEEMVAEALEKARGQLTAQAGGTVIRDDLITHSVDEKLTSVQAGSLATSYVASAKVTVRAFVVDDTDVLSLTLLKLQALAGGDEEFSSYKPDSFSMDFQRADFDRGEARIVGHLTGLFAKKTESTIFDTRALAGRTPAEVEEYFKQFPSVDSVKVDLSPFWVKSVPSREGAVEIVVQKK